MNELNLLIMKIKMFITSYCPLYFLLLFMQLDEYTITIKKDEIVLLPTVFAVVLLFLIIISVVCTIDLTKTAGNERCKYTSIERPGDAPVSYMMTYIVPLLSENFLTYDGCLINITLFGLIAIMYIRLDLVYFNPTWLILGYGIYIIDNGNIVISNMPYGTLKQYTNISLSCSYIVKGVYLIQKRDNRD